MPQEKNEKTWFDLFNSYMNVIFTKKDFEKYGQMIKHDLEFYKKYLKPNAKILDIGCGLGCTAVPLSYWGYDVTGIDNDKNVVEAVSENGKKFGRRIKIFCGDIFEIDNLFESDSFDCCISGGVLEHFPENKIKELIKLQLKIAPLVVASMPVTLTGEVKGKYKNYKNKICKDGIYRNYWKAEYWLDNILCDFNVVFYHVGKAHESIGGFDELFVVIKRGIKSLMLVTLFLHAPY